MRIAPGWITFLLGLVILAIAGILYQQSLVAKGVSGAPATAAGAPASPGQTAAAPAAKQLYTCPMHPQIIRDHPGTCPICGMELVPMETEVADTSAQAKAESLETTVAAVKLSPTQAVLSDIQPIMPTREKMALKVPAIGEVSVPQNQMKDIVSWQEGRVDNLVLAETGGTVKQGEHILDIYSEPLVQAQEEYLLALKAAKELGDSGYEYIAASSNKLLEASRQKLLRLGLSADQLAELETKGAVEEHLPIKSLYGGVVMDKMVTQGMYVMRGEKLFSVADLGTVWVELSVFEKDIASIKIGDKVTLKSPTHSGMVFTGRVELIEPEVNMDTRTFRVRVSVDNPKMLLRPGEILDAEMTFSYGNLLLLPRNAVLHTGDGDLVYVMAGENLWEPRRVTVGRDFGDKVEIISGIKPDEAVAATAVFLLDSEAQTKGVPRPINLPELPPEPSEESTHGGK